MVIEEGEVNLHAAFLMFASGQLRFLGSSCLLLPRDPVRNRPPTRFGDEYPDHAGRMQSLVSLIWAPGNIDDSKPAHLQLEFIVGQHETNAVVMGQVFSNAVGSAA